MIFLKKDDKLTERQKEVFNFIREYHTLHGYSPSLREIAIGCYCSKPVAQKHLIALIDKGFVTYTPKTARSIVILQSS